MRQQTEVVKQKPNRNLMFEFSVFLPPKAKTCECKHFKSVCLTNLLTVWVLLDRRRRFGWFSSVGQIIVIIVTKYVHVRVCLLSRGCVWEGVLMAVSCGRMAEKGWKVSVSKGVTVGMRWGQIRGKSFSINSFTAAISCKRADQMLVQWRSWTDDSGLISAEKQAGLEM